MRTRGFTLIELVVALVVVGVLMGQAVPSFFESTARARLQGAINELAIDLQYARSEAVRERAPVTLTVAASGASYTITNITGTLKAVTLPTGVTLTADATVSYDGLRGMAQATVFNAAITGVSGNLRVSTNAVGRVQVCTPSTAFGGYAAC
ncbi:MAG: GspH/FimT family pseudopilin [Microbacteriaceae bacterium]|nr:GspH/FimT family pseudopilin [Burkholderiaceae bacterium]